MLKKYIKIWILLVFSTAAISGCATIEGVGKDLEKAGEKIQEAVDNNN